MTAGNPAMLIPLYVHCVGITLKKSINIVMMLILTYIYSFFSLAYNHLTIEFILTPIPISVRQCMQFSQGSPAGTGNITFHQKVLFGFTNIIEMIKWKEIFIIFYIPHNTCPLYPCTIQRVLLSAF